MPPYPSRAAKLLTASVFAFAVAVTPSVGLLYSPPAAHAEGGGRTRDRPRFPSPKSNRRAAPADASRRKPQPGERQLRSDDDPGHGRHRRRGGMPPTSATGDTTHEIDSGEPADLVPNINGDSCTGYWESTVCYAEQGQAAVQPIHDLVEPVTPGQELPYS